MWYSMLSNESKKGLQSRVSSNPNTYSWMALRRALRQAPGPLALYRTAQYGAQGQRAQDIAQDSAQEKGLEA